MHILGAKDIFNPPNSRLFFVLGKSYILSTFFSSNLVWSIFYTTFAINIKRTGNE
nr:MAG TPA: hypothetical protein [Bacteriophage sp.]